MLKIQATAICYNGKAFLIQGKSGVGKSSLALSLVRQGAFLISDDITNVQLLDNKIFACPPIEKKGWLEVRSVGLISGFPVYQQAPIRAVIELSETKPERVPKEQEIEILDKKIPFFQLWSQDEKLSDKIWLIDKILSGELIQE